MKAKEWEAILLERMSLEEVEGNGSMGRYGVQASFMANRETGVMEWRPVVSLPDFDGVLPPWGRQFIVEAKVTREASFKLADDKFRERQYRHMARRARFGSICLLAVYFPERVLKTRTDPAETWAFPVFGGHPIWRAFRRGDKKSLTREDFAEHGEPIDWNCMAGGRKPRPDLLSAVKRIAERYFSSGAGFYPGEPEGDEEEDEPEAPEPAPLPKKKWKAEIAGALPF